MKTLTTPAIKALVLELAKICLDINTDTEYCAFFEINGHVESIRVRVRESKLNYQQHVHPFNGFDQGNAHYSYFSEVPGDIPVAEFEDVTIKRLSKLRLDLLRFLKPVNATQVEGFI